jgi:hypothetical protein
VHRRDFVRCSDLAPLPEEVVALYDDGDAARDPDGVLVFGPHAVQEVGVAHA